MSDAVQAFTLGEKAITDLLRQIDAERALADDLADALALISARWEIKTGEDLPVDHVVNRVMARYREARR